MFPWLRCLTPGGDPTRAVFRVFLSMGRAWADGPPSSQLMSLCRAELRSPPCATWTSVTSPWTPRPALWSSRAVSVHCILPFALSPLLSRAPGGLCAAGLPPAVAAVHPGTERPCCFLQEGKGVDFTCLPLPKMRTQMKI